MDTAALTLWWRCSHSFTLLVLTSLGKQVLRKLAKKYELSTQQAEKPTVDIDDLAELLQTNLTMTEKMYTHGQLRIDVHILLLLGLTTGQRPEALLKLRYRDLIVTLLRDPAGGRHRVLLEFTFEFTKEFLGKKDA